MSDMTKCGNEKHPNGPWHEASPLPIGWLEEIKQFFRRNKYGCGCVAKIEGDGK